MLCWSQCCGGDWVTLTSGKGQHLAEPQGSVLGTATGTGLQQQELTAREGSMQGHSCPWRALCALNDEGEDVKKGKEDEDGEEDEEGASSRFKSWRRQAGNSSHPCSSTADGSYHLCLGEISSSWHHFRAGKEGRTGGGGSSGKWSPGKQQQGGVSVACACISGANCKGRRALQTDGTRINGCKYT